MQWVGTMTSSFVIVYLIGEQLSGSLTSVVYHQLPMCAAIYWILRFCCLRPKFLHLILETISVTGMEYGTEMRNRKQKEDQVTENFI